MSEPENDLNAHEWMLAGLQAEVWATEKVVEQMRTGK